MVIFKNILVTLSEPILISMEPVVLLLLFFLTLPGVKAQEVDLKGTWTMFEMVYIVGDNTQTMTEDMMKVNNAFTDFFFMDDQMFKQTSNMSGSGKTDTYSGVWKIVDKKLIITLLIGEQNMDVDYTWEMKGSNLILTRTSPDGSMKIISTYKRKPTSIN